MTRISFVNTPFLPRFSRESRSPAVTKSDTLYFPKWLALATGYAKKCGHKVDLVDAPAWELSYAATADRIECFNPDLVVLDTSTPSLDNDLRFSEYLRNRLGARLKIALVGRGISVSSEYAFNKTSSFDFACHKEYEHTVEELARLVEGGAELSAELVAGISFRSSDGQVVQTKLRDPLENLDELPFVTEVYREFLDVDNYFYGHSLWPMVVFDTSRGCPYHCSFCAYPQTFSGHRVRYRSVANVADEFDYVRRNLPGVKTVMLEDDTFIVNKKRTLDLAEELIRRGNTLPFDSNCRVDIGVDREFLAKLKQAGARLFCVGFESGSQEVIEHMVKNNSKGKNSTYLNTATEFANLCDQVGIKVHGCFMFGNLNETKRTLDETLKFALTLPLDTAQFYPIMIYPGTSAYEEAVERNLVNANSYDDWLTEDGMHRSVVNLPNLTQDELLAFADHARRKFYLRPQYIFRKIKQSVTDEAELRRNLKGFKKLAKNLAFGSKTASYATHVKQDKVAVQEKPIKFMKKEQLP